MTAINKARLAITNNTKLKSKDQWRTLTLKFLHEINKRQTTYHLFFQIPALTDNAKTDGQQTVNTTCEKNSSTVRGCRDDLNLPKIFATLSLLLIISSKNMKF